MIAAIDFAVLLFLFGVAIYVVTRLFVKHSKKNDPLVKTLDMIFYKKEKKTKN